MFDPCSGDRDTSSLDKNSGEYIIVSSLMVETPVNLEKACVQADIY